MHQRACAADSHSLTHFTPAFPSLMPISQVNVDDGFLNLMDSDGNSKDDVKVPEGDIGKEISTAFEDGKDLLVTIISAMGEEQAISWKEAPKSG